MALILNIETSTSICSVALAKDGKVINMLEDTSPYAHSVKLLPFIDEIFRSSNYKLSDIDAIAVCKGPGSYTGLRIGVSSAKGICYALDKPLISISTLQAMANNALNKYKDSDLLFCPMIDARRMEVYCAVFNKELQELQEINAQIISEGSFGEKLVNEKILFFGDGAAKCKELLSINKNAFFDEQILCSAAFMTNLSQKKYENTEFEDVAYFEPFYLKDFVAGVAKGKLI